MHAITMTKTMRILSLFTLVSLMMLGSACKKKDPSVMKVFVRSANNELQANATVVIIADVQSEPATPAYVDTLVTNSSGYAYFEMESFFDNLDKDVTTGYFDILARKGADEGTGYIRARAHITNVKTVYLLP
jgi:hypothetical protein